MKRILVIALSILILSMVGVTVAAAVNTPEVDRANATMKLHGSFTQVFCAGEDGINYVTFRGNWTGPETDATPGFTDYNLTGTVQVTNIVWTINRTTLRGLLTGVIRETAATGTPTYLGNLVLITQGTPAAPYYGPARGWIAANTYTNAVADGGRLLANLVVNITGPYLAFNATGEFGNVPAAPATPNYAVTWNGQVC